MNESTRESIVSQILSDYDGDTIIIRAEHSERKQALLQILSRDPAIFLEKWGIFLTSASLHHFEIHQSDYEVQFYLRKHQARLTGVKTPSKVVKNRRHMYLDKLVKEGSFFSEEDMRKRDPALYEYYIGRHLTPEEKSFQEGASESSSTSLSQLLMKSFDRETMEKQIAEEQKVHPNLYEDEDEEMEEKGAEEEEEEDSESEDEDGISSDSSSSSDEDTAFQKPRRAPQIPPQQLLPEAPFVEEFEEDEEDEEGAEHRGNIKKYPVDESKAWGAPVEKDYWGSLQAPGSTPFPATPATLPTKQTNHPGKQTNPAEQTANPGKQRETPAAARRTKPKKKKKQTQMTGDEKEALRLEFLQVMQNRFLEGKEDFDYKEIDENEEYDDWKQRNRDLEEQYFDDDDDME